MGNAPLQSRLKGELNPQLDDAPELRALLEYWREKSPPDGIPNRSAINPAELKPHLGSLFIVEPLPGEEDFRYRLIGADITAINGQEFTGSTVRQLMHGLSKVDADAVINAYQIVVRKRTVLRARGRLIWAQKDYLEFDSLHLPIRAPDDSATWLLGKMTVLKMSFDTGIASSLQGRGAA